jgi:hypothetical protein
VCQLLCTTGILRGWIEAHCVLDKNPGRWCGLGTCISNDIGHDTLTSTEKKNWNDTGGLGRVADQTNAETARHLKFKQLHYQYGQPIVEAHGLARISRRAKAPS